LKSLRKVVNFFTGREKGEINIAGLMMMGIAMIFVAVGFIIYPVITDATDTILAYVYSGNNTITDASFTGLTSVTGIVPLIVLIGFLTAGVISGFMGYKMVKGGGGGGINLGSLLMLGIGMIFIAVGLIIFPVIMDGVASVLHGGGHGIAATYTGLSSVLLVTPLIVLTAFLAGGVVSSFFGIKGMSNSGK
jgi:hypothetical protein